MRTGERGGVCLLCGRTDLCSGFKNPLIQVWKRSTEVGRAQLSRRLPAALLGSQPPRLATEDCADASNARLCSRKNSFFPFQPHSHSQKPEHVKINVKGAGNTSKTICRLYVTDLINTAVQYLSNSTQVIHWPCYSHAGSPCAKMGQIRSHS